MVPPTRSTPRLKPPSPLEYFHRALLTTRIPSNSGIKQSESFHVNDFMIRTHYRMRRFSRERPASASARSARGTLAAKRELTIGFRSNRGGRRGGVGLGRRGGLLLGEVA